MSYVRLPKLLVVLVLFLAGSGQVRGDDREVKIKPAKEETAHFEEIHPAAYNFYIDGLVAEGFQDYQEAANDFRKAYQYHPDSYELGMAYAAALYRLRQQENVLTLLDRITPQDAMLLELKAACLRNLGRNEEAKDCYVKMVQQDSAAMGAYNFLSGWYRQFNDVDSTIWAFQNMRRIQPSDYRILNELARAYNMNDQFALARETYLASIDLSAGPENAVAVVSLAALYEQDRMMDSARAILNLALDADPLNINLHREVIRLYLSQDSMAAALPHVIKIAQITPANRLAQRHVGIMYFSLDSLRLADSVFTDLVAKGDNDPGNLFYMGRISLAREDYQRASEQLATLVKVEDTVYDNWNALAFAYRQLGETGKEIQTYRAGLEHMHDEGSAVQMLFALGATYERTDQVDSAIAAFEQILEHHPKHAASLNYLGYTLADRGIKLDYARELLSQAVELQPDNAAFLDSYGWVYFKMGHLDSAIEYLSQAANLDTDAVIYDHLGDAYNSIGERKKAREWWRKALEQDPENAVIKEKLEH